MDPELAVLMLQEEGLNVNSPTDVIPKSLCSVARNILDIPSQKSLRSISHVASLYGIPELEFREKLLKEKIIRRRDEKISRNGLNSLEILLRREAAAKKILHEKTAKEQVVEKKETDTAVALEKKKQEKRKKVPRGFLWRMVGAPEEMIYIQAGDIEAIHWKLVSDYARTKDPIDPPGVRDRTLLESATGRPHTSLGDTGKYPTIAMAGAALLHAIVHDHAFHNGNKRTALVSLMVFLDKNGYVLISKDDDLFDFVMKVSAHSLVNGRDVVGSSLADYEMQNIAQWLQKHIKRVKKGEFCLKFRELKRILLGHECCFDVVPGNRINIFRNKLKTQVFYASEGRDVDSGTIHKIRRDLKLSEDDGYDSDIFYNEGVRIDDFINKYRKTIDKLAKL
jgi:death-on-curing family protein